MAYDFDRVIDRAGTNATKLQKYAGTDILPFWIADMDFAVPDFILEPLRERLQGHLPAGLGGPPAGRAGARARPPGEGV